MDPSKNTDLILPLEGEGGLCAAKVVRGASALPTYMIGASRRHPFSRSATASPSRGSNNSIEVFRVIIEAAE